MGEWPELNWSTTNGVRAAVDILFVGPTLTQILSYVPSLRHVEVPILSCTLSESEAPETLEALRSLPQSITWGPLDLFLSKPEAQSTVQELCAAFAGTLLAQAVSHLSLCHWDSQFEGLEGLIAPLCASLPKVLHFELWGCPESMASSFVEAVAAWPMLSSIAFLFDDHNEQEVQQHLEAAARTAAELKAGQPFKIVLSD